MALLFKLQNFHWSSLLLSCTDNHIHSLSFSLSLSLSLISSCILTFLVPLMVLTVWWLKYIPVITQCISLQLGSTETNGSEVFAFGMLQVSWRYHHCIFKKDRNLELSKRKSSNFKKRGLLPYSFVILGSYA